MSIDIFAEHFADVDDPRQSAKVTYPLYDVLFLSICGVITGCEGWKTLNAPKQDTHRKSATKALT